MCVNRWWMAELRLTLIRAECASAEARSASRWPMPVLTSAGLMAGLWTLGQPRLAWPGGTVRGGRICGRSPLLQAGRDKERVGGEDLSFPPPPSVQPPLHSSSLRTPGPRGGKLRLAKLGYGRPGSNYSREWQPSTCGYGSMSSALHSLHKSSIYYYHLYYSEILQNPLVTQFVTGLASSRMDWRIT